MNLKIENPYKISDNTFVVTINGQEYEYNIPEDKDVNQIVGRINTWIERGDEALGGLYDWIKASFKMVGEYEQPIEEDEENLEDPLLAEQPPELDLPSDDVDMNEPIEEDNSLELVFNIEEDSVNISIDDWAADFSIVDDREKFTDMLQDKVSEEMTLKDRTSLLVEMLRNLDTDDEVNYYNLINLLLNTDIDIVDSLEQAEEQLGEPELEEPGDEDLESPMNDLSDESGEQPMDIEGSTENGEPVNDSQILSIKGSFKKSLNEDNIQISPVDQDMLSQDEDVSETDLDSENEVDRVTLDDLINNNEFLEDLTSLNLSLFAITDQEKEDTIYFIGGINNRGDKFTLSYSNDEPIDIPDTFDDCKGMDKCLNNIDDLNTVVDYIDKLLGIVYNQEMNKVHKNIEGDE